MSSEISRNLRIPSGAATQFTYDVENKLFKGVGPGGSTTSLDYDDGSPTPYRSILAAYGASGNNSVIRAMSVGFSEDLVFSLLNSVTLSGGYDSGFNTIIGYTTVQGTVTVQSGTLKIVNLVIR